MATDDPTPNPNTGKLAQASDTSRAHERAGIPAYTFHSARTTRDLRLGDVRRIDPDALIPGITGFHASRNPLSALRRGIDNGSGSHLEAAHVVLNGRVITFNGDELCASECAPDWALSAEDTEGAFRAFARHVARDALRENATHPRAPIPNRESDAVNTYLSEGDPQLRTRARDEADSFLCVWATANNATLSAFYTARIALAMGLRSPAAGVNIEDLRRRLTQYLAGLLAAHLTARRHDPTPT